LEGEAAEAISGLSLSEENYGVACDILQERFGRPELVRFSHIQELLNLKPLSKQVSVQELRTLHNSLMSHVRSLHNLGIEGDKYGIFLTPMILSCLPHGIRMEWAKVSAEKEGDLQFLLDFMTKEIENRERCNIFKGLLKSEVKVVKEGPVKSTATALSSVGSSKKMQQKRQNSFSTSVVPAVSSPSSSSSEDSCLVCGRKHPTSRCYDLVRVNFEKRLEVAKRNGLCFRCLQRGHLATDCVEKVKCNKCQGNHHFLFCRGDRNVSAPVEGDSVVEVSHTGVATANKKQSVLMQVLTVQVQGRDGPVQANVLFDSGSDRSYVSSQLCRLVQPSFVGSESVECATFGSGKPNRGQMRNVYRLDLLGRQQGRAQVVATEMDVISVPLVQKRVPKSTLTAFFPIDFVNNYDTDRQLPIDILVGLDFYWQLVKPEFDARDGMVAQNTVFGWMLSGVLPVQSYAQVSHQLLCICGVSDTHVRNLWEIDLVSGKDEDDSILKEFEQTVQKTDSRYVVALPWSKEARGRELVDNMDIAVQRLKSLTRKLEQQPDLEREYNSVFMEMEQNGIIEEVPDEEVYCSNPVFYLPHRPVVRESSTSTKVRPVFDASAKDVNGLSLNDCMDKGPNLIPNLVEILIKFRRWPVALVADIQKAFLQIGVRKSDQDVHRFLWLVDGAIRIMRILRVPFGNRSSPFLLNATIKHHLDQFPSSRVVEELKQNLYVDDWLTGADTVDEAKVMVEEATATLGKASMVLTKWGSNKAVNEQVSFKLSDKSDDFESVKILGLHWNQGLDCFCYQGIEIDPSLTLTKRLVLSFIAKLFDPLGFLSPFVITLKLLFQETWKLGLDWDSELPEELRIIVMRWLQDLTLLKNWKISRPYCLGQWKNVESIELHCFSDASEKAYGGCVFIVVKLENGSIFSSLVLAKTKVAPVKAVTLPRLELLGALLAVQLLEFVGKALSVSVDSWFCWSDAQVVLGWIKGDPSRWKPFVANRVCEIQRITNPSQWFHCRGNQNPADLLTRGVSADTLMKSELWSHGPSFLKHLSDVTEVNEPESGSESGFAEEEVEHETALISTSSEKFVDLDRFGTLPKCLNVVGWILRFVKNCRSPLGERLSGNLSLVELERAKSFLIRSAQSTEYAQEIEALQKGESVPNSSKLRKLSPVLDENGLLRVQTRLEFSNLSYEEKRPLILPKGRLAELIICFQHQLLKHAGVSLLVSSLRNSYWIIGLRRLAKKVKRQCIQCQKLDSGPFKQKIAPLPGDRIKPAAPFSVVGIDHAGPLYCADVPGKKFYILLITCAVVRAVHLELVRSLGTDDCVRALRKFIARRGIPCIIFSDNAKAFKATHIQLMKLYSDVCPEWKFSVPRAPWHGGWWERLVGVVKSALRKSVGIKSLTLAELEACLIEIEACVNSRPLTSIGENPQDIVQLTPSQFLIGRSHMYAKPNVSEVNYDLGKVSLVSRKILHDSMVTQFWDIWSKEYIRNLPVLGKNEKVNEIKEGTLVLVKDEGRPRLTWPLGLITQLCPGRDGVVRTVKVRSGGSEFLRPVQNLHLLEYFQNSTPPPSPSNKKQTSDSSTETGQARVTRYGRKVKAPQILDL
jgi:hypothetical protein